MKIELNQTYSFKQLGNRSNQEDSRYPDEDQPLKQYNFFVICDGVGGNAKGEIASRTVCMALGSYFSKLDNNELMSYNTFKDAYSYAYSELLKAMDSHNEREMATTLTFIHFGSNGVSMAHIGDSRIYQIRPDVGIIYRSNDHSLINALVHSGNITPQEAINNPKSNYITRCMCYAKENKDLYPCDFFCTQDVENNDIFFLCTDGVTSLLSDEQIYNILTMESSDIDKIKTISNICKNSYDNNTAFLIKIKNVVRKEDELQIFNINENSSDSLPTALLKPGINQIREIKPQIERGLSEKIASFIKKHWK